MIIGTDSTLLWYLFLHRKVQNKYFLINFQSGDPDEDPISLLASRAMGPWA